MFHLGVNAIDLANEIHWFSKVLDARVCLYFQTACEVNHIHELLPPNVQKSQSEFATLVSENKMGFDERVILALALMPYIKPQILDIFFIRNKNLDRGYTEFGGWKGGAHNGFLPTLETAVFLLAGDDLQKRFEVQKLFTNGYCFQRPDIFRIERGSSAEPFFSAALLVSADCLSRCTVGATHQPDYNTNFPAKLIITTSTWKDLVLAPQVLSEIELLKTWMRNADKIMNQWGLGKTLKPGYRSLFYGPPGTGKTLTAALIGVEMNVDVYRIDLSMLVSKYIGETEKNLSTIFDQAENRNWILFFDEADALFGKRTQTTSSNDRYANQEVSYLLQRVEDHPGIVILATNLRANIDEAFARRFQSLVYFPLPTIDQRLQLWKNSLNEEKILAKNVDLSMLSVNYEMSGGAITNVVRHAALSALRADRETIEQDDLIMGVMKELKKEGKTV